MVFKDGAATGPTELVVPPSSYPMGWMVESDDPAGQWHHDPVDAAHVVRVTTPNTGGTHTIRLRPKS